MTYEEFKSILAVWGITSDSHAVITMEQLEESWGQFDTLSDDIVMLLPDNFHNFDDFFNYDPRASKDEIEKVEETLKVSLPEDYVKFLKEFGGPDGLSQRWPEVFSAHWNGDGAPTRRE
jgi:hypothetical protein